MLNRLRRDNRGAVMVLAAASFTVLLLFAGLALDFGRAHLLRAQLQTAVDAAALAGALQVIPMVDLSIHRWERVTETCTDPVSGREYDCSHWESVSPLFLSGPKWDLLTRGGWRLQVGDDCTWPYRCTPTTAREWLVMPDSAVPVAQNAFQMNATWPGGNLGPHVGRVAVSINQAKVEVTAQADMTMPTTFLKLVGIRELTFRRTGTAVPVPRS